MATECDHLMGYMDRPNISCLFRFFTSVASMNKVL